MEQVILISAQAYIFYYVAVNVYLVLSYTKNTNKFRWEDVAWLLVFGFMIITFLGINELKREWEEW